MEVKICTKCKEEKLLDNFSNSTGGKLGKHSRCKKCISSIKKEIRDNNKIPKINFTNSSSKECNSCGECKSLKEYNKRKISLDSYHYDCKKCLKDKQHNYYSNNKDRQKCNTSKFLNDNPLYLKNYYQNNKAHINKLVNSYNKIRRKNDPLFKLKGNIRCLININFKYSGYKKNTKNEQILGCSKIYLKQYLESKFESWMNWDNYGKYNGGLNHGWDIDHITPLSSTKIEDEFIKLNHYSNLQPLCSKINRDIKRDKINYGN
jgi:hypothetical protein